MSLEGKISLKLEIRFGQASRVGKIFQANLPENKVTDSTPNRLDGKVVWRGGILPDAEVEEYLNFVRDLFPSRLFFSEESALFFLHSLNYNIPEAKSLLSLETLPSSPPQSPDDDSCTVCNDGGNLICCDYPHCSRGYHLDCVGLSAVPQGAWICPCHYCFSCGVECTLHCISCTKGYCSEHVPRDWICLGEHLCSDCSKRPDKVQSSFLYRLFDLNKKRGTPIVKIPKIGRKELDLYGFYVEVIKHGIYHVIKYDEWDDIKVALGYPINSQYPLLTYYMKLLYPYEKEYYRDPLVESEQKRKIDRSEEDTESEGEDNAKNRAIT